MSARTHKTASGINFEWEIHKRFLSGVSQAVSQYGSLHSLHIRRHWDESIGGPYFWQEIVSRSQYFHSRAGKFDQPLVSEPRNLELMSAGTKTHRSSSQLRRSWHNND